MKTGVWRRRWDGEVTAIVHEPRILSPLPQHEHTRIASTSEVLLGAETPRVVSVKMEDFDDFFAALTNHVMAPGAC